MSKLIPPGRNGEILSPGKLKQIHVNGQVLRANRKLPPGERLPVYRIRVGSKVYAAWGFLIADPTPVWGVTSYDNPLSCGATAWLETKGRVVLTRSAIGPLPKVRTKKTAKPATGSRRASRPRKSGTKS